MPQILGAFAHYDYVAVTRPSDTTEVYTYKNGGASGTTVGTLTVTYTDSTKNNIASILRVEA